MYRNDFVVVLQDLKGNTLRETREGFIHLPFGTEYKFLFKNKSFRRAVVSLFIDGTDALGGSQIVVDGNTSTTLERFILDGDNYKGHRFKFVDPKKDPNVQDPDSSQNGVVRIIVQYEKYEQPTIVIRRPWNIVVDSDSSRWSCWPTYYTYSAGNTNTNFPDSSISFTSMSCSATPTKGGLADSSVVSNYCSTVESSGVATAHRHAPANIDSARPGATVEGSESNQSFYTVSVGTLEDRKHIFEFRLLGRTEEDVPVTVKPTNVVFCGSCGTKAKWEDNYCKQCGHKLDHKEG